MIKLQKIFNSFISLGITLSCLQYPALAAEKVIFSVELLGDFDVQVDSLETFAKTGTITPDLQFYTQHLTKTEIAKLRHLLNQSFSPNALEMFEFLNTEFGKEVIKELSQMINTPANQGQLFLRGAMITVAENPDGFKIIDVITNYGSPNLALNLEAFRNTLNEVDNLYQTTERVFQWLDERKTSTQAIDSNAELSSLTKPGDQQWTSETFMIPRPNQGESLKVFVYLPETVNEPAPLIVIAPGLNSDFQALEYIAKHLASHGFATVGIDFPESDHERMTDSLQGLDTFPSPNAWMEQPKDVTLVLDTLAQKAQDNPMWQGKFDSNNVGILGHSLGGYTATAIGGAEVQWDDVLKKCSQLEDSKTINLNPALLWQCNGAESTPPSPNLQDDRIKAIIAINPVTNPTFGSDGINKVKVPMMFIAGSKDIFAPSLPEQIVPFSAMENKDKYLLLVKNSTHLSFIQGTDELPPVIVGEGQEVAYDYLKSISLAFFKLHLNGESKFEASLTQEAAQVLSTEPLPIHLIQSLTQAELDDALKITE